MRAGFCLPSLLLTPRVQYHPLVPFLTALHASTALARLSTAPPTQYGRVYGVERRARACTIRCVHSFSGQPKGGVSPTVSIPRNFARIRGSSKFINNNSDPVWSSVRSRTTCASVRGTTRSPFSLSTLGCNSTHRFHSPHRRTCPRPSQVWLQLHRLSIVDCTKVQDVRERAPYDAVALFTLLPPKSYSPHHFCTPLCRMHLRAYYI